MGEIADSLINGDFDALTGEYLGEGSGFPRTRNREHANSGAAQLVQDKDGTIRNIDHNPKEFSKGTKAIRKELAKLIKKTIKESPNGNKNKIVNDCRQAINLKYGKGWREQL